MAKASNRWSFIFSTIAAVLGLALSYNIFVDPGARLAGHAFDGLMFFGPGILTAGLLLMWLCQPTATSCTQKQAHFWAPLFLMIGLILIAVPALLFARLSATGNEEALGMFFTLSLVFCGLPGLVLVCVGVLRWRTRFSLRTLLIATTLVAVGMGAIVYAVR